MLVLIGWYPPCWISFPRWHALSQEVSPMAVSTPEGRRTNKVEAEWVRPSEADLEFRISRWRRWPRKALAVADQRPGQHPWGLELQRSDREMDGGQGRWEAGSRKQAGVGQGLRPRETRPSVDARRKLILPWGKHTILYSFTHSLIHSTNMGKVSTINQILSSLLGKHKNFPRYPAYRYLFSPTY